MVKVSRRKLADRVVSRLSSGDAMSDVMKELAAYLITEKRTREADLIVRDIEMALLSAGTVATTVTSARELTHEARNAIRGLLQSAYGKSATVSLDEIVDPSVIGGVKIETPDQRYDGTIKAKLEKLTA